MLNSINFKEQTNCNVDFFKKADNYNPISCDVYDHLEIWSMQRTLISITYEVDDKTMVVQTKIKTLLTKESVEYLVTAENITIRLDHIHSISTVN